MAQGASDPTDGPKDAIADISREWEKFIAEEQSVGMPSINWRIQATTMFGKTTREYRLWYSVVNDGRYIFAFHREVDAPEDTHEVATRIRETLREATDDYLHAGTGWVR